MLTIPDYLTEHYQQLPDKPLSASSPHAVMLQFGKSTLAAGTGVLDVAGGKGELSLVLSSLQVPSTIIDPREHSG